MRGRWPRRCACSKGCCPTSKRCSVRAHPHVLLTRHEIAYWTGEAGAVKEAVGQFRELLPEMDDVFSPAHLRTLRTRQRMAHYVGEAGQVPRRCACSRRCCPTSKRCSARAHPHVLRTEYEIAYWKGGSGKVAEALRQFAGAAAEGRKRARQEASGDVGHPS